MSKITIGDISIDVVKKDIKNLHLGVYPPDGRVRIAAPLKVEVDSVRLFAVSKLKWIKQQKQKFAEQERQSPREYISGESHYFQGRRYLLNVVYHNAPPSVNIRNKKYIDLFVREGSSREKRRQVMNDWYRQDLKKRLAPLIENREAKMKTSVNSWSIRHMKTKWGTCNPDTGHILFNLELAKKPTECLDYIVVHEMVHLFERRHNDRFLKLLDRHLPNWRMVRQELNALPLG